MTFVPIVTHTPTQEPSRQTRELADLLGRVIQEYEKAHPTVSGSEVRQALQLATRASSKGADRTPLLVAMAGGLSLLVGLGVFFAVQGGGSLPVGPGEIMMVIVLLGIVMLALAVLRKP